jgi:ferredoxin
MKAHVDELMCEGSGFCARVAPAIFVLPDAGPPAVASLEDVPAELEDVVLEAEQLCPVRAILLDDGGR